VAAYLVVLLRMSGSQWRELGIAACIFALGYTLVNELIQRRIERSVMHALDEEELGVLAPADLRGGFSAIVDLPRRMFLLANLSWLLAAVAIPLWMRLRLSEVGGFMTLVIAVAAVTGGFISSILVYFTIKRVSAPLREAWATEIPDPDERAALVSRVPLAAKIGVATCAVVSVTVLLAVLLSYAEVILSVEMHAARMQRNYLERLLDQRAHPGSLDLSQARTEARELGIADDVVLLDTASETIVVGSSVALSSLERRYIASAKEVLDSRYMDSDRVFAWVPLDDGRMLVAVAPAGTLASGPGGSRKRFASLLGFALGVALICSWMLASDVSRASEGIRQQAERLASGDPRTNSATWPVLSAAWPDHCAPWSAASPRRPSGQTLPPPRSERSAKASSPQRATRFKVSSELRPPWLRSIDRYPTLPSQPSH
jgi:hypothetical protein